MPSTNSVHLHRILRASPERIYRAFLDPEALTKWLPPFGFTCRIEHLDARPGGSFRMAFTNFSSGHSHSFGGKYVELVPNQKLRYTDRFDDPNLSDEMHVTVNLRKVTVGTELTIEQTGIPSIIPAESCYLGWQESLLQLANVVEPEVRG